MAHKITKNTERCVTIFLCFAIILSFPISAKAAEKELPGTLISEFLSKYNLDESKISFSYFNAVTSEEYMYNENKLCSPLASINYPKLNKKPQKH